MFSNLLFLIIVLLSVNFVPHGDGRALIDAPALAFGAGMLLYGVILAVIALQNRLLLGRHSFFRRDSLLIVANVELIAFLLLYHFLLRGHRLLLDYPLSSFGPTVASAFSLLLYFLGLALFHRTSNRYGESHFVSNQLRMVVPFAIPFLLFTFLLDLFRLYPDDDLQNILFNDTDSIVGVLSLFALSFFFMALMLLFLPAFIVRVWRCKELDDMPLRGRLERICHRCRFNHGGMKTWTVMNSSLTAAIIGIVPPLRYVMFTKRILREFSPEMVEGILAHEIGHAYHKHLLIYPFIIFGMIICGGIFSLFFSEAIVQTFALWNLLSPSVVWQLMPPLFFFLCYALIMAFYFRYIFGYFSRLFERQADLHVYIAKIPPAYLISALDRVAVLSGYTHKLPSWHHWGIGERIRFLRRTEEDPSLIQKHHSRVRRTVTLYLLSLIAGLALLLSPLSAPTSLLAPIGDALTGVAGWINEKMTRPWRRQAALEYLSHHDIAGNRDELLFALQESYRSYAATQMPEVVEYYAAKFLLSEGEQHSSLELLTQMWRNVDVAAINEKVFSEFTTLTEQALRSTAGDKKIVEARRLLDVLFQQKKRQFQITVQKGTAHLTGWIGWKQN